MAEVTRYVDPDATGAGNGTSWADAYNSLNAWEAAEQTNLDTANDNHVVHCRASSGGDDTTACAISGWTTSAADDIEVIGDDFPVDGVFDGTKYFLDGNDAASSLRIYEDFVTITNLQIRHTTTSGTKHGIEMALQEAGAVINIDSCIIKGVCSGTGSSYGISTGDADATVYVYNTVVYDFLSTDNPADGGFQGIRPTAGILYVYNSTVYNCYYGMFRVGGTMTVINCAVFNCTDDWAGTIGVTYSASDDAQAGTGNVTISQSADDWAALVTDAAGGDFSVTNASSELYQTGNGATPKGIFTDDIIGTERDAVDLNWDIGAFELTAVVAGIAVFTHHYQQQS